jgi:hypothetical protein
MTTSRDLTENELELVVSALRSIADKHRDSANSLLRQAALHADQRGHDSESYRMTEAHAAEETQKANAAFTLASLFNRYEFTMHSLVHIPEIL